MIVQRRNGANTTSNTRYVGKSGEGFEDILEKYEKKYCDIEDGKWTEVIHHKLTVMELCIVLVNSMSMASTVLYVNRIFKAKVR